MNLNKRWQQVLQGTVAVLSLALLASCGGGKREPYVPGHMYIFGDEYSYINNYSSTANLNVHYSLNKDYRTTPIASFDPFTYALWAQYVAASFGKSITLASDHSAPAAGMSAVPGETVDSMLSKMNATAFQKDELITISIGVNDIIAAYNSNPTATDALKAKAAFLGERIIAITKATGARVVIAEPPDISLSPYAVGRNAVQLKALVDAFDIGLRRSLDGNYGHQIALVTTVDWSRAAVLSPATYGIVYPSTPLCTNANTGATDLDVTPEKCTDFNISTTLGSIPATTYFTYLWAWNGWLAPQGQYLLGQRAITQMRSAWGE